MADHKDTDEVFIVIDGEMSIAFRDGEVKLSKGEMYVIPKGVVNTGEISSEITAENNVWI